MGCDMGWSAWCGAWCGTLPMAERTTQGYWSGKLQMMEATSIMRSALATDEPPNFMTTVTYRRMLPLSKVHYHPTHLLLIGARLFECKGGC